MKNVSNKSCRQKHTLCSVTFFRKSCRLWDKVEEYGGAREPVDGNMAASRMLDKKGLTRASKLPRPCNHTHAPTHARKHTHTHTHTDQYVILTAFPQQQWFSERASLLRYTYIACLVLVLWDFNRNSTRTLHISWPIWVKFGVDVHIIQLSSWEFYKNLDSESHTLLLGVHQFPIHAVHSQNPIRGWISTRILHELLLSISEFSDHMRKKCHILLLGENKILFLCVFYMTF